MTNVSNAIQAALDAYDRPDLENVLKSRVRSALYELHGAALFPQDLTVSSPVTYEDKVEITTPTDMRMFNRVIAYVDGVEQNYQFTEASVINPLDYYGAVVPRHYLRRGNKIIVSCTDVAASAVAMEYYKYPSYDQETLETDSWIPEDILIHKLTAYVAKFAGKQDEVSSWERKALETLEALYGA